MGFGRCAQPHKKVVLAAFLIVYDTIDTISKKFKSNPIQIHWIWQKWLNPDLNPNLDLDLPTIAGNILKSDFLVMILHLIIIYQFYL